MDVGATAEVDILAAQADELGDPEAGLISTVRLVSSGVKRWRYPAMVRRWVGTGMIEAQRSFRRIKGCKDMDRLVDVVRTEVAHRLTEEEGGAVTPVKYDQPAA
jgi:hypothetical protein